jgi:hypothetical protein
MSLDYNVAYHCHCTLSLNCGSSITLKSLTQEMTYIGLLEGVPSSEMNDRIIQSTIDRVRKSPGLPERAPFVIPPTRRDFFRKQGDMARALQFPGRTVEWLPVITCIGMFESILPAKNRNMHASGLTIVWFQDEYAMPISEIALGSIKSIDWASQAFDFEY